MTTDTTNLARQRRQIERELAAGIIRRTVRIPASREAELAEIVATWKEGAENDSAHTDR